MTSPTSRRSPAGRYDEPSRLGQRILAVVLTVLVVAFVAVGGRFAYERFGGERVSGAAQSYDVRSDREVAVEVEVSKPAGATAFCLIRARGADGSEVGRDVAPVDPVGTYQTRARGTFSVTTSSRAVTGEVTSCRVEPLTQDDITRRPAP